MQISSLEQMSVSNLNYEVVNSLVKYVKILLCIVLQFLQRLPSLLNVPKLACFVTFGTVEIMKI